ncbi:hypothetical protein FC52_GL000906 [Lactobacillus pasteurii DSM 23907 = CRBIP 24.76]|uniref:Uncharacterized protein n=1 Tax=Lactobacillus pasteurii DSM 23907 = CRBIP 24.76 TaxID=1423790 RepID=I7LDE7_9LACO|nr:hypothetical protein [Lactobacillus pasteurii]KRK08170.1 hypothetical protein FC52_GL000906 [Lactobacillus pasteurii DSM 23907 = CRBIP 24.76]CCI84833.1 Protein of unknown function [Lactobacillus pasteurii DSM 23907 = CRBIP 24.76]
MISSPLGGTTACNEGLENSCLLSLGTTISSVVVVVSSFGGTTAGTFGLFGTTGLSGVFGMKLFDKA